MLRAKATRRVHILTRASLVRSHALPLHALDVTRIARGPNSASHRLMSANDPPARSPYEVLGLPPGADAVAAREAFKRLALQVDRLSALCDYTTLVALAMYLNVCNRRTRTRAAMRRRFYGLKTHLKQ